MKKNKKLNLLNNEKQEKFPRIYFFSFIVLFIILYGKLFVDPILSGDFISQFYTAGNFNKQYFLKHFNLPFWNPYLNAGTPNLDPGFSYNIFYLLFVYLFPLEFGTGIGYALITLLGGIFAYMFFSSLKLNKYTAIISSLVFMFAGNMVSYIYPGHIGKPLVLALLPLVWFFINRGLSKEKFYYFIFAGFFMGFQYLGHPQIFYYSLIMTSLYFFFRIYWHYLETKDVKVWTKGMFFYGILGLSAVLISFNQIWEQYTYSQLTSRTQTTDPAQAWMFATSWSEHPLELLTYFIPSLFGLYDSTYLGWKPFVQTTDYMGFITMLFVFIGIITNWKKKHIKFITYFSLFTLLFGMGKHFEVFYRLFYNYFPLIKQFRVPSSIYIITTFCFCYLFIYGLNSLFHLDKNKKKILSVILVFIVILFIFTIYINSNSYEKQLTENLGKRVNLKALYAQDPYGAAARIKNVIVKTVDLAKQDLQLLWILFIIFLLVYYFYSKKSMKSNTFIILVGILVLIDLMVLNKKFIKTTPNYDVVAKETDVIKVLNKLKSTGQQFRITPLPARIDNESNKWMLFDLETAHGYNAIALGIYDDVVKHGWFSVNNLRLLGLMNVKYILNRQLQNHPDLELVYQGRSKLIYENKKFMERFLLFDKYTVMSADKILAHMNSQLYQPQETLILEEKPPITDLSKQGSSVKLLDYSHDAFSLQADVKKECLLFLSEIYYPKWKAFIKDKELKIYKANYLFRAVVLPKGNYKLQFKFHNNYFYLLSTIFHYLLTVFILAWIFILIRKKEL